MIHHCASGKYWSAQTRDFSASGALLGVDAPRQLSPGDMIEVFIAWQDRALLSKHDGVAALVKRVLPVADGKQLVGVEFTRVMLQPRLAAA